jgi:predicted amidohydrolase YtcJ
MDRSLSRRTLVEGIAAGTVAAAVGSRALAQEATPAPAAATPVAATPAAGSSGPITIFQAKKIVTLHEVVPEATHVAVREGRILGAGKLEDLTGWGKYTLDETFKDLVIVPGLIEAHNHVFEGIVAFLPYVGFYDRPAIDGSTLKGITTFDDLITYLKAEDAKLTDPDTPLIAFGFDAIYFWGQDPISKTTLDQVSTTRQVAIWYASEHTLMLNTTALAANNITAAATDPGVLKGADGEPTGGLNSPTALVMARSITGVLVGMAADAKTIQAMARFGLNAGCTMVTDMASTMLAIPGAVEVWGKTVNAPGFPTRVGIYLQTSIEGGATTPETIVESVHTLRQSIETDMLRITGAKLVLDGSIQEFTAFLRWPGYYQGPNDVAGQLMTEEEIVTWMTPLQEAGIQIATHCNGDAAVDLFLNAIETVTARSAAPNARYSVQHSQLTTPAQYKRMATLGVCANIFANHLWYWGDQHYEITVGPERAEGMEACATALAQGVPFSLHTDANVTPLGCLHSMWCAVNRVTPQGRVLGEAEKISAEEALRAVTLGSAYLLGLDEELGSIQTGKWADFTVLEESPLDVDPMAIKDIAVWGTVLAGVKQPGAGAAALSG